MTLTAVPEIVDPVYDPLSDVDPERELTCECDHHGIPCGKRATVRVTAVCQVVECGCGAWTAMACAACLEAWRRLARRDGVHLRIHPLR